MRILVLLFALLGNCTIGLAFSVHDGWIQSVAYIANESTGGAGTGFFVARSVSPGHSKIFLVSNKHVLNPRTLAPTESNAYATATLFITTEKAGVLSLEKIPIVLRETNGNSKVVGHPRDDVDVAVMEATSYVTDPSGGLRQGYRVGFVAEDQFATTEGITNSHLSVGDRIILLGYPLNLVEGSSAIPVARGGTISTPPERDFRGTPVFLIDCPTIRGSSGSPVFSPLRPCTVELNGMNASINPMGFYVPEFLGMVSATIPDWELILKKTDSFGMPPTAISVMDTANFGIVFRADSISETLDHTGCMRHREKK